ncbi:MAG: hypothetical protein ACI9MR_000035 [Myxococcota bacterium]|jgi:hypothetical protein
MKRTSLQNRDGSPLILPERDADPLAKIVIVLCIMLTTMVGVCDEDAQATPPQIGTLKAPEGVRQPTGPGTCTEVVRVARVAAYGHADSPASDHELPTREERELVHIALHNCDRNSHKQLDVWAALQMLRIEKETGVPPSMRLITLAAWCGENRYGDAIGDGGSAVGPLQMHEWWERVYGTDRRDPAEAARSWLSKVRELATGKALKRCGKARAWHSAELWVSQGGRKSDYSCTLVSGHVVRLMRWQRIQRRL